MKEKLYNALPYLVLLTGLLNTGYFWYNSTRLAEQQQEIRFNQLTSRAQAEVQGRLQSYVDELIAAAALIKSSDKVSENEWKMFVEALQLDLYYPGINGLGFAVPVSKADSARFISQARNGKQSNYTISGLGQMPQAPDLLIIKFIEPMARNKQALGFDMGSEPVRRQAMERARDTHKPAITTRIELVQDKENLPGFLIYVPVYKATSEADTAKEAFLGWTYAPFIARNFMEGILQNEMTHSRRLFELELYGGRGLESENLLFKSRNEDAITDKLVFVNSFPVYGNTWSLRITPTKAFIDAYAENNSILILIGGTLLSFLLFFLLRSLADTRRKAMLLAEEMTVELRTLNADLDKKVAERTQELAQQNEKLNLYTEHLKNSYEDLEVKVKFRNLELQKQLKALQDENERLKANKA